MFGCMTDHEANADGVWIELSLEDTLSGKKRALPVGPRKTSGYNPYETLDKHADRDKTELRKKATDLHKLAEWIRLTREIEKLKKEQR
jgi:hypothetical protein